MSVLIGFMAGVFGSLVGLGGGLVMIPMMTRLLGLPQSRAHGTSLSIVVVAGLAGALAYARAGNVDVTAALVLAAAASLTSRAGARACSILPEWKLQFLFGCLLLVVSALLVAKPHLGVLAVRAPAGWPALAALACTGLATGFIMGLLGIGGGAFLVAGMVLFVGMGQHVAQGSSLLGMVPAAAVGAYTHWRLGNVVTGILPGLAAGIILGSFLGGTVANVLPEQALRVLFAAVLIWLGVGLIRKSRQRGHQAPSRSSSTRDGGGVDR